MFFFQAEDGIRDLVRSRGLGDVYKRQVLVPVIAIPISLIGGIFLMQIFGFTINLLTLLAIVLSVGLVVDDAIAVSYTHLTLPTSDLV